MTRRVLHLIETGGPGGAERVLLDLVRHLDAGRFSSLVCLRKPGWLHDQLRATGVQTVIVPLRRHLDGFWFREVRRLVHRERVALLHCHEFAMNVYGAVVSWVTGRPAVATVHGKNYYPDRGRRRLAYRVVARIARMVAVSEDVRGFLAREVGVSADRVSTLHNGIDLRRYRPAGSPDGIRRELLGGDWPFVIGTVGSLYPVKGHTWLLRAYRQVRQVVPGTACLIAGQGGLRERLREEARQLGVEDGVKLVGFREDVPRVLAAMDVFVLPSLSEGLPLAALEAMASGRPVVATDVGGVREVVSDGVSGFLVPPQDAAALATPIVRMLRDGTLAAAMGRAGANRVQRDFSVEAMVARYEALYESLLAAPTR